MPLELCDPTLEDATAISNLQWDSFGWDPVMQIVCPLPPPKEARDWLEGVILKTWTSRKRKVIRDSDSGEVISQFSYYFSPAMNGHGWKKYNSPQQTDVPAVMNLQPLNDCGKLDWEARVETMGSQPFIYFASLSTIPNHERRGAGGMFLDFITQEADRRNLPIFLVATPRGRGLYLKHGFVDKKKYEYDLSSIGEAPREGFVMVRAAPNPGGHVDYPEPELLPVQIVPMENTEKDLLAYDECVRSTLGADPLVELCFQSSEEEPLEARIAKEAERLGSGDFIFHKAIDPEHPDGPPLGFGKWMLARDPHTKMHPFSEDWPAGANVECCEAVFGKLTEYRENYYKERNQPYAYMATLVVATHAQRRGVGSELLREGLRHVDSLGWDTYIDASPAGLGLYKKFGWDEAFKVTVNLKDFGGPDLVEDGVSLRRPPGAKERKMEDVKETPRDLAP